MKKKTVWLTDQACYDLFPLFGFPRYDIGNKQNEKTKVKNEKDTNI